MYKITNSIPSKQPLCKRNFFSKTMEKTVGLGNRMDLIFHNIRLGLFFMDHREFRLSIIPVELWTIPI